MEKMIKICEPDIGEAEKKYVNEALDLNELSGHGKHVGIFEKKFAEYIGVKHAILVQNGTVAPYLALRALGVGVGDEVIIPSQQISCVAGAVSLTGATLVVVDVDKDTWTIDPKQLQKAVTRKTKAIIPTPIFGGVAPDYDAIQHSLYSDANREVNWKIYIIEDFAEAIGSKYKGAMLGSLGDIGTCSFFANKNIQTGEGGALTTDSDELDEKLRYIRNCCYGKDAITKFWAADLPFNWRPHNLVACLGLGQLERIDYLLERRQQIHKWYMEYLSPKFIWQKNPYGNESIHWMNGVLIPQRNPLTNNIKSRRDEFINYMKANGVETRPCFPPVGQHPYLNHKLEKDYSEEEERILYPVRIVSEKNSQFVWENGALLPSGGKHLTENVIKYICRYANAFVGD